MSQHIVSLKTYVAIFLALLTLTATTVGVAYLDLGRLNTVVALVIAFTKALLVALFFMHLRYSSQLTKIVAAAGLAWLAILLGLTMGDYLTRDWIEQPKGWAGVGVTGPSGQGH